MKKIRFYMIIVAVFAAFCLLPFFNRPRVIVTQAILAAAGGIRDATVNVLSYGRTVFFSGRLIGENEALKNDLSGARARLANDEELKSENDSLRALLNLSKRDDIVLIGANVVGAEPSASSRAVTIDRGSLGGISRGDAVVFGDGIMIGKIENVAPARATVLLTVDPKCAVSALVAGHPEASGVATGDRGLVIKFAMIPMNAAFETGDEIITSGEEENIPRGLVLGNVDSVSRSPSEPFSSATVVPSYDQNSLTVVAVVHKK
jgi:rod shape-determining protein MreC